MSGHAWNTTLRRMEERRVQALLHRGISPSHRTDQTVPSTLGQDNENPKRNTDGWYSGRCEARKSPPTRRTRAHASRHEVSVHQMPRGGHYIPQEWRNPRSETSPAPKSRLRRVRGNRYLPVLRRYRTRYSSWIHPTQDSWRERP